jgi:fucose permease
MDIHPLPSLSPTRVSSGFDLIYIVCVLHLRVLLKALDQMAIQLEGNALLYTVTTLTCFGFLLIGFDNGLMGGFVNSPAFTETFGINTNTSSGTNTIALIVSIYEIGSFIGAVTTSFIEETLGRGKSVLIGVLIMIVGK